MVTTLSLFLLATAATAAPVFDVLPPRRRLEGDWRPGTGHLQLDTARQLGVDQLERERREKVHTVLQLVVERRDQLEREKQLETKRREQLEREKKLEREQQLVVEREEQLERERREQLDTVLQLLKNPMVHQITNKHYGV